MRDDERFHEQESATIMKKDLVWRILQTWNKLLTSEKRWGWQAVRRQVRNTKKGGWDMKEFHLKII